MKFHIIQAPAVGTGAGRLNGFLGKSRTALVFALVLFVVAPHGLNADIIYLRTGRQVIGKITGQSRTTVKIRVDGRTRTYSKRRIRRIKYETLLDVARREQAAKKRREDARRAADAKRKAEEKRKEEARKAAEEKRKREEAEKNRKAEEERKRKEAARIAALKRKNEIAARRAVAKNNEKNKTEKRTVKNTPREKPQLLQALWKSALIPGWGQDYQGRTEVSRYYTGHFLILATLARGMASAHTARESAAEGSFANFILTAGGLGAVGISSTSQTGQLLVLNSFQTSQQAQARADALDSNLSTVSGLLAALYLWNIVDAFFFHPGGSSIKQLLGHKQVESSYRITLVPERSAGGRSLEPGVGQHRMEAGLHFRF